MQQLDSGRMAELVRREAPAGPGLKRSSGLTFRLTLMFIPRPHPFGWWTAAGDSNWLNGGR